MPAGLSLMFWPLLLLFAGPAFAVADSVFRPQINLVNNNGKVVLTIREGDWIIGKLKQSGIVDGEVVDIFDQGLSLRQQEYALSQFK